MKKNFLFTILAVFLAGFGFGGISMADSIECTKTEGEVQVPNPSAVAKIGEICYDSIASAYENIEENGTIVLISAMASNITISPTKVRNFKIDGTEINKTPKRLYANGLYTISYTISGKIYSYTINDALVKVNNGGTEVVPQNLNTAFNGMDSAGVAKDDGKIILLDDIEYGGVTLQNKYNITLDLGGHTLTLTKNPIFVKEGKSLTITNGKIVGNLSDYPYAIYNGGELTIKDDVTIESNIDYTIQSIAGSKIIMEGGIITAKNYGIALIGNPELNFLKGTINAEKFAIAGNGTEGDGGYNIIIKDGTITSTNAPAIYHPNSGTLTIEGGTIEGSDALYIKAGSTIVNGGTLKGNGVKADYIYNGNGVNPTGDGIVVENADYPGGIPTVTINGGTISSTNNKAIGYYKKEDSLTDPTVTSNSNEMTLTDGWLWTQLESDNTYKLTKGVIVTFKDGDEEIEKQTIANGGNVSEPEDPTKEGNIFVGWFNGEEAFNFETAITADTTLTAHWEEVTQSYTITLDPDGGEGLSETTISDLAYNSQIDEPTGVTKEGYTLEGWYDGENQVTFPYSVTSNVTLKAKWNINSHTVTFKLGNGEDDVVATVEYGKGIEFTEPVKAGNIFKGWNPELPATMPDTNVEVNADWDPIPTGTELQGSDGTELDDTNKSYSIAIKDDVQSEDPANEKENNKPSKDEEVKGNEVADSGMNATVLGGLDVKIKEKDNTNGQTKELANATIQFKNSYKLRIPVNGKGIVNGSNIWVKVSHRNGPFGLVGLTLKEVPCSNGVVASTEDAYTGGPLKVTCNGTKCYVEIYTCSASQFVAYTQETKSSGGSSSGGGSRRSSSSTETTTTESNTGDTAKLDEQKADEAKTSEEAKAAADAQALKDGYSQEFIDAYNFARKNNITTKDTIREADMDAPLTRIAMAKMLSQYAINVLGKTPDTTVVVPTFPDVDAKLDADYNNGVTLAYQLGIMGIGIEKFRPFDLVTRAEFGTALSRMLFGLADGEGDEWYKTHLDKLMEEMIITNDNPDLQELRGYVMIMLMRSAQ